MNSLVRIASQPARRLSSLSRQVLVRKSSPAERRQSLMIPAFLQEKAEQHGLRSEDPSLMALAQLDAPFSPVELATLIKSDRDPALSRNAKMTGAGVVLVETKNYLNQPCLILFRSAFRPDLEEPGGFLKQDSPAVASAIGEVYEESCMTISHKQLSFLPHVVDVSGRSRATMYRSYIATVSGLHARVQDIFKKKAAELEDASKSHCHYSEMEAIARVPIHTIREDPHSQRYVAKDCSGNEVVIGERTSKILRSGALNLISSFLPASVTPSPEVELA